VPAARLAELPDAADQGEVIAAATSTTGVLQTVR
jgi:hypothetical protein